MCRTLVGTPIPTPPPQYKLNTKYINYTFCWKKQELQKKNVKKQIQEGYENKNIKNNLKAVSYTHLDVYKRQFVKIVR